MPSILICGEYQCYSFLILQAFNSEMWRRQSFGPICCYHVGGACSMFDKHFHQLSGPLCVPRSWSTWLDFPNLFMIVLHLPLLPLEAACSPEWVPTVQRAGNMRHEKDGRELLRLSQTLNSLRARKNLSESGQQTARIPQTISEKVHRIDLLTNDVLFMLSCILSE